MERWRTLSVLTLTVCWVLDTGTTERDKCRFLFPAEENGTIISNGSNLIEFGLSEGCNITKPLVSLTIKDGSNNDYCSLVHKHGMCQPPDSTKEKCQCLNNDTGWYSFEASGNGTMTWTSTPPVVKKQSIDIVITGHMDNNSAQNVSEQTPNDQGPEDERREDGLQGVVLGAVYASGAALVLLAVTGVVVCLVLRNRRARTKARDLYRGSNVSITINNEVYEGTKNTQNSSAAENTAKRPWFEDGVYSEVDDALVRSTPVSLCVLNAPLSTSPAPASPPPLPPVGQRKGGNLYDRIRLGQPC